MSPINLFFILRPSLLLVALAFTCCAKAQLCSGSLGDPVVNITFGPGGSSTNFTPPSGYIYTSSSCPDDGYYTVTSATSNCFGNSWHTVPGDHTGNGSFMLVNASFAPGDFFLATVTDLCPNTTYEFAAWIMNVLNRFGIRPNITFRIETPGGVILKEFQTGDINTTSQPLWLQYGFYFTTPSTNAIIVLRMTNNAPGGIGNDLALDDITFRPCGPLITANIVGNTSNRVDVCEGTSDVYTFNGTVGPGFVSPLYRWQMSNDSGMTWSDIPGANAGTYIRQPTAAGGYWYRLSVVESSAAGVNACRISSNEVIINIHAKPVVDAGPDRIVLTGNSATLAASIGGEEITYSWSPNSYMNDITALQPVVSPVADIWYKLSATSVYGCSNEDDVLVKVVTGIYIPNAFTPNGDGRNDTWMIPFLDPAFEATVNVFNRYGQLVYQVVSGIVSWDGKLNGVPQASGVYIYLVTFKGSEMKLKGSLMLIR
ncbi:MAG: gliding motility-associated C-terminal domain-containing protein [Chitinophagales bacterium]